MDLILGMDAWVFTAWIGTILAAVLCVLYGIYHQYVKKSDETKTSSRKNKRIKGKEEK